MELEEARSGDMGGHPCDGLCKPIMPRRTIDFHRRHATIPSALADFLDANEVLAVVEVRLLKLVVGSLPVNRQLTWLFRAVQGAEPFAIARSLHAGPA